ncbi:MAG: hypothetical protein ACHQT9_02780 [Candidatus Saccharimonadales bacterium]
MKDCPETPYAVNCGWAAAQFLVAGEHIVIDPLDRSHPLVMDREATVVLEVLNTESVRKIDIVTDVARFGCIACGRKIEIVDDDGELSVRGAEG